MFILYANKNQLAIRKQEPLTSGSVNVYSIRFEFSSAWDGLEKTVVYRVGRESISVLLEGEESVIPWEALTSYGKPLMVGVYGSRGRSVVLPTVWANLGVILEGAAPGDEARPPTPDLWEQQLSQKGDGLSYDGLTLSLLSGGKELSSTRIMVSKGDHRYLANCDAEGQHPITAITGLEEELSRKVDASDAISIAEIIRIMED